MDWWFETPRRSLWRHCNEERFVNRVLCWNGFADFVLWFLWYLVDMVVSILLAWQQRHDFYGNDDVIKWKHFPRYWPFVWGIHRSPVNSPHRGQWRGALMFSLICVWINSWINNREAGELRRYRAHSDVIVINFWWAGSRFLHLSTSLCGLCSTNSCDTMVTTDNYRQVSNIRRTLVGNKIVDHSDVVGASPVGAAPTTSSFST